MTVGNTLEGVGVGMGNTLKGVGVGIAVDVDNAEKVDKVSSHIFANIVIIKIMVTF